MFALFNDNKQFGSLLAEVNSNIIVYAIKLKTNGLVS